MPNRTQVQTQALDRMYQALADPTRRAVVARLCKGPASVSELAAPSGMSLPAFVQHLRVLEASGLVASEKQGRVRTCRIQPKALSAAESWIAKQRALWHARFDRLEDILNEEE